ncbi:hypothetical protein MalM25_13390 [Planctomycetes bacterium MalM25]|nr:hypothetical protein MalM25_13390 [Planctomycetes bacterium MalM25]
MSDSPLTDEDLSENPSATAVVEPEEKASGPTCEKCGQASDAAACPRCGWYPSLGIHVEIDEAFEAVMNAPAPDAEGEPAAAPPKPGLQQHLEVWRGLIPGWGWLMIGTTLGVVGAGVAVRVASLSNPGLQSYAGVTGLIGGLAVLLLAHVIGFLLNSFHDADSSVSDLVIKPLKSWKVILAALPERLWLANSANAALTTALTSALIIGGIPYERLLDWGFKARPKASLIGMIADQASKNQGGSDNLEDAVEDLAGTADGLKKDDKDKKPEVVRQRLECLILGYRTDRDGQLTELLLAADQKGKLKSIGKVRPTLSGGEKIELVDRFKESTASRPFVKTSESANWLRPRFTCRVTYNEWPDGKRPKGLKWEELLDEVKMPW